MFYTQGKTIQNKRQSNKRDCIKYNFVCGYCAHWYKNVCDEVKYTGTISAYCKCFRQSHKLACSKAINFVCSSTLHIK